MAYRFESDMPEIAEICRRFRVERLAAFGSATTDRFNPANSDIDLLVEFQAGQATLRHYFGLREALQDLLNRPIDLASPAALRNPYFAESVAGSREELYAA